MKRQLHWNAWTFDLYQRSYIALKMEWMRTEWAVSEILWMHLMLFPPAIERALVSQQCTLHIRQQLQFSLWSWGILGFVWLELSNLWIGPLFHPFYHIAINGQKKNLETSTSLHSKSRIIQLIVTKWMGFRTNRKTWVTLILALDSLTIQLCISFYPSSISMYNKFKVFDISAWKS